MRKLEFRAETITPLVIAGADNRNPVLCAEGLRVPSLRGVMRWWFRAMMGGIVGCDASDRYEALRAAETAVFGATERKSCFRLLSSSPTIARGSDNAYLCMNDCRSRASGAGKDYDKIKRSCLPPGTTVTLRMTATNRDSKSFCLAMSSLWLLSTLGGVGGRNRRGFGSIALTPGGSLQSMKLEFGFPEATLSEIASRLSSDLQTIHCLFAKSRQNQQGQSNPQFGTLSRGGARLYLLRPRTGFWSTWDAAMRDLRDDVYRAYKTRKGLREIGSARPRCASPLIIQIKRSGRDKYFGVLLAFENEKYFGRGWTALATFLNSLTNYECVEVPIP